MTETTTSSENSLAWYLRSLADHDTHRGRLSADGAVTALCGAQFIPKPTVRVVGEPPGRLVDGPPELALPPVPEQVCPECRGHGTVGARERARGTMSAPAQS